MRVTVMKEVRFIPVDEDRKDYEKFISEYRMHNPHITNLEDLKDYSSMLESERKYNPVECDSLMCRIHNVNWVDVNKEEGKADVSIENAIFPITISLDNVETVTAKYPLDVTDMAVKAYREEENEQSKFYHIGYSHDVGLGMCRVSERPDGKISISCRPDGKAAEFASEIGMGETALNSVDSVLRDIGDAYENQD